MTFRYSNIFITAPSPENLKAVHEFIFKGFEALHYQVCMFLSILVALPVRLISSSIFSLFGPIPLSRVVVVIVVVVLDIDAQAARNGTASDIW